jgi:hypothetical protein
VHRGGTDPLLKRSADAAECCTAVTLRGYWPLVFLFSGYLIAKQLAILKILNNLKHATDRLQMPSSPHVVK